MKDYESIKYLLERAVITCKDMGNDGYLYCKGQLIMAAKLEVITYEQYVELYKMIENAFTEQQYRTAL